MNDDRIDHSIFHALDTTIMADTDIRQHQSKSFRASTATVNYAYQEDEEQTAMEHQQHEEMKRSSSLERNEVHHEEFDATATIHEMHRKLLYLMSNPELFHSALDWQNKIDQGLDPSLPAQDAKQEGLEYEEEGTVASDAEGTKYPAQQKLIPPLPLQIFTTDAEVVLPEAMTANQLFGIERVTGIELEAAAGIAGLSLLFLRWLALMPEGDHQNVIDPPGLTVMRIAGGRYRVTGSHRVVWRWMNKFSPASAFANEGGEPNDATVDGDEVDTDFDFGDLVSMTIIDVFETDFDGKLLSYCPTFDNRAVHKTQEVVERVKKGASHLKERVDVVVKSPTGQKCIRAASHFGMRRYTQAITVGNIVKHRIEEELHKRQAEKTAPSETSLDAVAPTDIDDQNVDEDAVDNVKPENTMGTTPALETISSEAERLEISGGVHSKRSKNEYYFSDDSTAATPQPVSSQEFV